MTSELTRVSQFLILSEEGSGFRADVFFSGKFLLNFHNQVRDSDRPMRYRIKLGNIVGTLYAPSSPSQRVR